MLQTDKKSHRGVTLLLVLGLMTMFAMLVVTFMIITTQARSAAVSMSNVVLNGRSGGNSAGGVSDINAMPTAIEKLLIGDNLESVLGPFGMLDDLYGHPVENGNDLLTSSNHAVSEHTDGTGSSDRFLVIELKNDSIDVLRLLGKVVTAQKTDDTSEEQKILHNKSTLIVNTAMNLSVDPLDDPGTIVFSLLVRRFAENDLSPTDEVAALKEMTLVFNSAPFSGTGPGHDIASTAAGVPKLTLTDGELFVALRPNILAPGNITMSDGTTYTYKEYLKNNLVMMNSDYTAPDHLTMFLAHLDVENGVVKKVIPSFHRPALIGTSDSDDTLRKKILRPLPFDHSGFTGSNAAFDPINGPWDVDGDLDGVMDSIWLDIGLSIQNAAGGKRVKPLVAYLVLDMDGRLNLNAHGSSLPSLAAFDDFTSDLTDINNGGLSVRGFGYGPAEVRLDKGFEFVALTAKLNMGYDVSGGVITPDSDQKLFVGTTAGQPALWDVPGRYGYGQFPAGTGGFDAQMEMFADLLQRGGVQPDFLGQAAHAFDRLGNRKLRTISSPDFGDFNAPIGTDANTNLYRNNPYYMDPYSQGGGNEMFTAEEMQAVLRSVSDRDFGQLPPRIRKLIGETEGGQLENPALIAIASALRYYVTSHSSDIPAPARPGGYEDTLMRQINMIFESITDPAEKNKMALQLVNLLPREIWYGEKMSLNEGFWMENGTEQDRLQLKAQFAQRLYYLLRVLCHEQLENGYIEPGLSKEQIIDRLAQWCVNVVDFMDPDATMTPFIYDRDPFNPTKIGDPDYEIYDIGKNDPNNPFKKVLSNSLTVTELSALSPDVRLIFGVEKPEVVITETLATHNRGVADSGLDKGITDICSTCSSHSPSIANFGAGRIKRKGSPCTASTHGQNFDQVMIPQGSLFVELVRIGNPQRVASPQDSATSSTKDITTVNSTAGINVLNLALTTSQGHPVWRMMVGAGGTPSTTWSTTATHDALAESINKPGTYSFQPRQWKDTTNSGDTWYKEEGHCVIEPERYIWFGNSVPSTTLGGFESDISDRSYYNRGSATPPDGAANTELEPNQYLVIGPRVNTSFISSVVGVGGASDFGTPEGSPNSFIDLSSVTTPRTLKTMIAAADAPSVWTQPVLIGVNVSEPLPAATGYYQEPDDPDGHYTTPSKVTAPVDSGYLKAFGTYPCYKTLFLQRLADPNRDYHPICNPYITVDWSPIDLHVFNSEKTVDSLVDAIADEDNQYGLDEDEIANGLTPEDTVVAENGDAGEFRRIYFQTREVGNIGGAPDNITRPNLLSRIIQNPSEPEDPRQLGGLSVASISGTTDEKTPDPDTTTKKRDMRDIHLRSGTLGYLNNFVVDAISSGESLIDPTLTGVYQGAPKVAFTHFPWNDTAFANTLELMQVPASTPGRLGIEFYDTTNNIKYYNNASVSGHDQFRNIGFPVGHLLNFFDSSINDSGAVKKSLNLARIFEYLAIPSRFNGTKELEPYIDPVDKSDLGIDHYRWVQRMREPGKINLNTANEATWAALGGDRSSWPSYSELRELRGDDRGFDAPFRSPNAVDFVTSTDQVRFPVEASLLRSTAAGMQEPFFNHGTATTAENTYNMLENVQRLSEMTTCRSNVFAVWITIGYFEVDSNDQLGQEYGLDKGTNHRERTFLLIDRSIPVGFRRGDKTLNYKDVILFQKRLE